MQLLPNMHLPVVADVDLNCVREQKGGSPGWQEGWVDRG